MTLGLGFPMSGNNSRGLYTVSSSSGRETPLSTEREGRWGWGGGSPTHIMAAVFGPEREFVSHSSTLVLWSALAAEVSLSDLTGKSRNVIKRLDVLMDPNIRSHLGMLC